MPPEAVTQPIASPRTDNCVRTPNSSAARPNLGCAADVLWKGSRGSFRAADSNCASPFPVRLRSGNGAPEKNEQKRTAKPGFWGIRRRNARSGRWRDTEKVLFYCHCPRDYIPAIFLSATVRLIRISAIRFPRLSALFASLQSDFPPLVPDSRLFNLSTTVFLLHISAL